MTPAKSAKYFAALNKYVNGRKIDRTVYRVQANWFIP